MSRTPSARSLITNGSVSLIDSNIKIAGDQAQTSGHLGIEEALDLALLIPYNPVQLDSKKHFNVYVMHGEQREAASAHKFVEFY